MVVPHDVGVKILALLKDAEKMNGYRETLALSPLEYSVTSLSDLEIQSIKQAPIYGTTPDVLLEKLKNAKLKSTKSLDEHPDLSSQ